LKKDRIVIFFR